MSEARRAERYGVSHRGASRIPFFSSLFLFADFFFLSSFLCRPNQPALRATPIRPTGRRSPSGRTAHPHHACVALRAAHPGNPPAYLPAHRPSAHGPTGRFSEGKIPPTALRAGISAFFRRKKYPLWAHFQQKGDKNVPEMSDFLTNRDIFIDVVSIILSRICSKLAHLCPIWAKIPSFYGKISCFSIIYAPNWGISGIFHWCKDFQNISHFNEIRCVFSIISSNLGHFIIILCNYTHNS